MRYAKQHNLASNPNRNIPIVIYRIHDDETWEAWIDGKWSSGMSHKFDWVDKKEGRNFYNYEISEKEAFIEIL